jgi:signal transduction histidine kinase
MNYLELFNGEILLGIFTFLFTTYLGLVVFLKNHKSWTSRLFIILSFLIDAYIIINYLSLHPPGGEATQLFWIRLVMFTCSFIGPALILLVTAFPGDKITIKRRYVVPLILLMTASAIASLTPAVFSSLSFATGEPVPVPGKGIPIFFLDFVGLFVLSFIILIHKFRRSTGTERAQILYFLLGVIATFSFMAITTVIFVVILKTSATVFLGPLSSVILISFIAYSIVKYHLFDIKVVATEALVAVITIVLLSEGVLSGSAPVVVFKLLLAALIARLGVSLIRSVKKEIAQREELANLAKSLEKANAQLKELDRQKTDFLSIAAHQLRTPLSIINGYIELLGDGAYGKVTKATKDIFNNIDESNGHLIKLVDEFLDITRIEQGRTKFDFAEHDMTKLIDGVVKELEQRALERGPKLVWSGAKLSAITMDEEKVRHVVFNFIDNAIKYSEHGDITITAAPENGGVTVRVVDRGFGFGPVDQPNFFQKFYRGENVKNTNVNGTGLGLYVCRKFIENHGGRVWAKSPGLKKGSEFGFWIPLKPTPPPDSVVT